MTRIAFLLAAAGLAAADASAPPDRMPPQGLGSSYGYEGSADDRGLSVEVWRNHTLHRTELWHKPDGDYYLKVDERTYVRGWHDGAEWRTDPSVRLVWRDRAWRPRRA